MAALLQQLSKWFSEPETNHRVQLAQARAQVREKLARLRELSKK